MDTASPTDRVLSGGRDDLLAYRERIVASTASLHGYAIDAIVTVACAKYIRQHEKYVAYLAGPKKTGTGEPGHQGKSHRWNEANEGYVSVLEALAAAFAVLYPSPTGRLPVTEVDALVQQRVGPLCTGWTVDNSSTPTHHPRQRCPVHDDDDPQQVMP